MTELVRASIIRRFTLMLKVEGSNLGASISIFKNINQFKKWNVADNNLHVSMHERKLLTFFCACANVPKTSIFGM